MLAAALLSLALADDLCQPKHIRIAWGNSASAMTVVWSADRPTDRPSVEYSLIEAPQIRDIEVYEYQADAQWEVLNNTLTHHFSERVLYSAWSELLNLQPGSYYQYRVGSQTGGWSQPYFFRAKGDDKGSDPIKFIVFGDLGVGDQVTDTIASLITERNTQTYEAIIHVGDFAYDFDSWRGGKTGDKFMDQIEPLAAYMPYMVTQGNHENARHHNQEEFSFRFKMPGSSRNLWYSFAVRNAYFLALTVEPLLLGDHNQHAQMMEFLLSELRSIDRDKYSWVIALFHRPIYCSAEMNTVRKYFDEDQIFIGRNNGDCLKSAPAVREGLETLFAEHAVDLLINGHIHAYERLGPAYHNRSVGCQEESTHLCVNAKAPITVISGNPGQDKTLAPVSSTPLPWSTVQSQAIGYGRVTIFNATHLLWEQVKSSDRSLVDHLWLVKE